MAVTAPTNGTFVVTLSHPATVATIIAYTVSGTAASGADYVALSGSVAFAVGSSSATIPVTPLGGGAGRNTNVVVTLQSSSDAGTSVGSSLACNTASIAVLDYTNVACVSPSQNAIKSGRCERVSEREKERCVCVYVCVSELCVCACACACVCLCVCVW